MNNFRLESKELLVDESLLYTGNGYIGVRGNFEEGYPESYSTVRGAYIASFYETIDVEYGESAHGFPKTAQKLINVFDPQSIKIEIDGEQFSLFQGEVLNFHREMNIEKGYSLRDVEWVSPKGHHLKLEIKRMTSFETLELMLIDYTVTSVNYSGMIRVNSSIEGDVSNYTNADDPRVASKHAKVLSIAEKEIGDQSVFMAGVTNRSKLKMAVTMAHDITMDYKILDKSIEGHAQLQISEGASVTFAKYIVYTDSIRHSNLSGQGKRIIQNAVMKGKEYWYAAQKKYLDNFWKYAKVDVEGEGDVENSLNYNIYQLLASVGKDIHSNISAKGLSGEGYEGHYFWDTEIYIIPFFTLANPTIAKNLLMFRYNTLPYAKEEALIMGHTKGAKIPWRTISGSECSAYFPGGSAQYHINADVAYSNIQYYLYTLDLDYICDYGYEILYETARLWLEIGHFNDQGQFFITGVTGPDEYTAIVNNNYYTNAMAGYHLQWTVKFSQLLKERYPSSWEELVNKLQITENEINSMDRAGQRMFLPYSDELGINLQDDGFLNKKEWDFENVPKEKYPLVLNYHPLIIYSHKVLKQADTVLCHFLLDNAPDNVIQNSYYYYEKLTTHDSSLSPCVHSIMASRINNPEKAYHYLMDTLRLDLDNLHGNTKDGLHIANAGGAYMAIVYGFGGLRIKEDGLHLRPTKPPHWSKLTFRLNFRGALVKVTLGDQLLIETDQPIDILIDNKEYHIENRMETNYHERN